MAYSVATMGRWGTGRCHAGSVTRVSPAWIGRFRNPHGSSGELSVDAGLPTVQALRRWQIARRCTTDAHRSLERMTVPATSDSLLTNTLIDRSRRRDDVRVDADPVRGGQRRTQARLVWTSA